MACRDETKLSKALPGLLARHSLAVLKIPFLGVSLPNPLEHVKISMEVALNLLEDDSRGTQTNDDRRSDPTDVDD